ncbi:heterokaryon incompatibility protein-domain-containing protein [Annulohypoxylon maeteangense]|uniref:heterokaryon incompatibility protein-domain-containing protein n=1 Tax=Annulohypoxylon maeteangense TaxID=1927788 RepID=UPI0020071F9A|nr:heterokaryon incompatibility protein-domain-containing protein [Annulohypoxylon maeteangense]KAI0881683.1 heterokaryon incompatibility protein-domain-containing protein [Annulohypoxylon maeteangense]
MRLLNVHELVINEYQQDIPPYAILSHTWSDDEVSFVDFVEGKAPSRKGYYKILGCCKQAIYDGLEYVWIDTCCIDKRSSAELSEAVNSMFNWYRDSTVCYAHLEDVPSRKMGEYRNSSTGYYCSSSFKHIRWITRGWTLQELIAPSVLVFFTSDWISIGSRDELKHVIAEITHIDPDFFLYGRLSDFSIARRMSWASHRQTSRIEDQAYCLLGLFGITMPLVYGEGKRAFVRLQEEIIKESNDQSIFAWCPNGLGYQNSSFVDPIQCGLLAPSPLYFATSGSIVRCGNSNRVRCINEDDEDESPYTITNRGIQISLPIIEHRFGDGLSFTFLQGKGPYIYPSMFEPSHTVAVLNCRFTNPRSQIVIFLREDKREQRYVRMLHKFELTELPQIEIRRVAMKKQIFIRARNALDTIPLWLRSKSERIVIIEALTSYPLSTFQFIKVEPEIRWQRQGTGALFLYTHNLNGVVLLFRNPVGEALLLLIDPSAYSFPFNNGVHLVHSFGIPDNTDLSQCWQEYDRGTLKYKKSPNGPLSIRLIARQAAHAYIIRLELATELDVSDTTMK